MQKKIVAGICAAALALALPFAAFAAGSDVSSQGTATINKVESGNVTLSDIKITGAADYVKYAKVTSAATTTSTPANAIAGSVATFDFTGYIPDYDTMNINAANSYGTMDNKIEATVKFAEAVTANLPSSVALDNLYLAGRYYSNISGQVANIDALDLGMTNVKQEAYAGAAAAAPAKRITVNGLGTGKLVVWMQNGKYAAGDVNNTSDLEKSAQDSSKSPKTGEVR